MTTWVPLGRGTAMGRGARPRSRARAQLRLLGVLLSFGLVDYAAPSHQQLQAPGELRRSLVLAGPTEGSSRALSLSRRSSSPEEYAPGPAPAPGWRSWRQQMATDQGEVKRLRQMLSQAEEDVEVLNDRLADARQAQKRANHALKDKDTRLNMLTQQLRATSEVRSASPRGARANCCPCSGFSPHACSGT